MSKQTNIRMDCSHNYSTQNVKTIYDVALTSLNSYGCIITKFKLSLRDVILVNMRNLEFQSVDKTEY